MTGDWARPPLAAAPAAARIALVAFAHRAGGTARADRADGAPQWRSPTKRPRCPRTARRCRGSIARARSAAAPGRLRLSGRAAMLLALVVVDCLAALAAFHLGAEAYLAVTARGPKASAIRPHLARVALSLPIGYWLLDVYRVHGQAPIERFPLRIKATCLLFVLLFGWYYAIYGMLWPLGAALPMFLLAVVLPLRRRARRPQPR